MIRHLGTTALTMGLFVTHALGQVVITRQASVFINPRESAPIQKAAQDLASDMQNVFGAPVRIIHDPAQAHSTTIWISDRFDLPASVKKPSGWEKLHIQAGEPGSGCSTA